MNENVIFIFVYTGNRRGTLKVKARRMLMSSPTEVNTQQILFVKILVYRSQNVKIGQDLS